MQPSRALARAEATALVHLLDLADEPVLGRVRGRSNTVQNSMERRPGPIVLGPTVQPQDAPMPIRWHCSQTASRSEGSSAAGLTIVMSRPSTATGP